MGAKRNVSLFIVSFAMIFLVLTSPLLVNATSVPAIISVGGDPQGIAYDSETGEIYVANFGSNTVSVINDSSNTVVATIEVGTQPKNIAYDSGKGEVFVTNWGSGTVSVISDRTHLVVATIPVGTHPVGIAYDSAKSEIFVANSGDNTVSIISDTNNTVVTTVTTGTNLLNASPAHGLGDAHPIGITYDLATNEIYVVNSYPDSSGSGTVSVISDSNNSVLVSIPVGELPHYAAYDSRRGDIFVTNLQDGFVSVISDTTHNVIAQVTLPKPGASGGNTGITYDFKTGEIFVLNRSGTVFVISNSSLPWMDVVSAYNVTLGIGGDCFGIAYNDAKESIFVANGIKNNVSVFSTSAFPQQTPNPTIPEFSWLMILSLTIFILSIAVMFRPINSKNNSTSLLSMSALLTGFRCSIHVNL